MTLVVPSLGPPRALRSPKIAEAKLRNGLRVLVVRKATVPRVELRLITPFGGVRDLAAERVLPKTLMSGTSKRDSVQIAQELQRLGATFGSGVSADHFQLSGSVLAPNLRPFLELAAEIITEPTFPAAEVSLERDRSVQELEMSLSRPEVIAYAALRKRMYRRHRYGTVVPKTGAVARVTAAALRELVTKSVGPRGGVIVAVGDVQPQAAIDAMEETIGRWRTKKVADDTPPPPEPAPGAWTFVDRPGSVQTCIRIGGSIPAVGTDASYALDIANTIFGGYFISRWVDNLRERNGYTYSPHSTLNYQQLANHIEIAADVGTEVTVPSMVETLYELGRMCALDVSEAELESAKRYRTGIQALRIQSQAGLAATLAGLVTYGLGVDYLKTYPRKVGALTAADIRRVSADHLAPGRLITVLVGDAASVADDVRSLANVDVQTS
jgi:predicted Zn-dependent peptidase